jgi:hypothetical protein
MGTTPDYIDQQGSPSAPSFYNHTNNFSLWAPSFSGTGQRARIDLTPTDAEANSLLLKFYGNPGSPSLQTTSGVVRVGQAAVWGVSLLEGDQQADEYMGDYLGLLQLTIGNDTLGDGDSGILPDGNPYPAAAWVREVLILEDRSLFPAMRIVGQEDEAAAMLVFDSIGYSYVIVELRCEVPAGYIPPPGMTSARPSGLALTWRVL